MLGTELRESCLDRACKASMKGRTVLGVDASSSVPIPQANLVGARPIDFY